jgi:hypothetical protein
MIEFDQERITELTDLNLNERKSLIQWYVEQPEQVKLEAHKLQLDLLRQNRHKQKGHATEFSYSMLIEALRKMKWIEGSLSEKANLTPEQGKKINDFRIERAKARARERKQKPSLKKNSMDVQLFHIIKRCREEKFSWRMTTEYLAKHHKFKASHTYVKQTFERLLKLRGLS